MEHYKFLLTRPYGRDHLIQFLLQEHFRFYSHAHTGVIPATQSHHSRSGFLLTRPYGRDQEAKENAAVAGRFYSHAHTGVIGARQLSKAWC